MSFVVADAIRSYKCLLVAVARMKRSGIRECESRIPGFPDSVALHPGYGAKPFVDLVHGRGCDPLLQKIYK